MMVTCDLVRHTVFMLVSTLGFLFTNFYDEVWRTLSHDFTVHPVRTNTSLYPDNNTVNVITNGSNLTTGQDEGDGSLRSKSVVCQQGYTGQGTFNRTKEGLFQRYNKSDTNSERRFQCMRVALDGTHWFVVCVDEKDKSPRHWDQSQIEHIYSWLTRFPDVGLIDLHPGNGFYGLAAGALNRTSLVIAHDLDSLQRIHKGISISGLSQKVRLYEPRRGQCTFASEKFQCQGQNGTANTYDDVLGILNPPHKTILRARVDKETVDILWKTKALFRHLCIPFVITEINPSLVQTNLLSLTNLAETLISEYGYRPITYNRIALALNNLSEWPEVVYWRSSFGVI